MCSLQQCLANCTASHWKIREGILETAELSGHANPTSKAKGPRYDTPDCATSLGEGIGSDRLSAPCHQFHTEFQKRPQKQILKIKVKLQAQIHQECTWRFVCTEVCVHVCTCLWGQGQPQSSLGAS